MIERQLLEELLRQKLSTPKIAAQLGVSENTVRYWEGKYDLKAAFGIYKAGMRRKTPEERAQDGVRSVNAYRRRLKSKAIAYKGGKCALCGYSNCNAALEFHHLDRKAKSFGVAGKGFTRSWESVKVELDKCVLVCSNCHREVEAGIRAIPAAKPL